MSRWKITALIVCSTLPLLFAYTYHIVGSYAYDNDFGRDLVDIYAITRGDITLLGPKLSFGGLHTGPYYYYLFAPVLFLFPGQPELLLYANALLAWLALVLLGIFWYKLEKWSLPYIVAALYWLGLSNYFLFSARGPGNAFSYVGWLALLIGMYPQIWKRADWRLWALYGLGWGIVVNFHLAVLFIALPLLALLAFSAVIVKQKLSWKNVYLPIALKAGFIASFAPLVLFELTHNFVMIRNTFIDKSYEAFLQNGNLAAPLETSANPIRNLWLFLNHTQGWVWPSMTILLLAIIVLMILNRKTISRVTIALGTGVVCGLVLVALAATSQLAFHYLFPFIVLGQITIICLLAKNKYAFWIVCLVVIVNIATFPYQSYQPASRNIDAFRQTTTDVMNSKLASQLAGHSFQIYVTREVSTAPIGHEYRYFFANHGLFADPPSAFAQSERILWIAEQPLVNPAAVTSWELEQFGPRTLLDHQQIGSRTVYLFGHQ